MIWLVGGNGMLGSEISRALCLSGIQFVATGREVDITRRDAVEKFCALSKHKIGWIVNCAAYTNVERAETDEGAARLLNVEGARNVARAAKKCGAGLVHFSTDYVFGKPRAQGGASPYDEDAEKSPLGIYGATKSEGEDAVQCETARYYILRTAWLYGFCGKNFVYTMTRLMNTRDKIKVVCDQRGTPTNAADLAFATLRLMAAGEGSAAYGVYHYTNEGEATWFEFAKQIYAFGKKFGRVAGECEIVPCTTEEFAAQVERPKYSVLSKAKIRRCLNMEIPAWQDSLEKFISDRRFDVSLCID